MKHILFKSSSVLFIIVFLVACEESSNTKFNIPKNIEFNLLEVESTTSEGERSVKRIEDKGKISELLLKIKNKNLKVKKLTNDKLNLKLKKLNQSGFYNLILTKNMNYSKQLYRMIILNNGNLIFQHSIKDKEMYFITKSKYPKLTKEIKQVLSI